MRLTERYGTGEWGLRNYDIKKAPPELYGPLYRLKEYEDTGLSPDDVMELIQKNPQRETLLKLIEPFQGIGSEDSRD